MGTKASQESLDLFRLFDAYYYEAIRVQKAHASDINILIGMEIDWIRPSSQTFITALLEKYPFNLFIGSVHHVHTIPIDYDHKLYVQARDKSGGTDAQLAEDYFDAQYEMLKALKPPIIGHFDLIRLKSDNQEASFTLWEGVWQRILRNLKFIAEYGGILELNSAAMRKGMSEPYPKAEICKVSGRELIKLLARRITNEWCEGILRFKWTVHALGRQSWCRPGRRKLRPGPRLR